MDTMGLMFFFLHLEIIKDKIDELLNLLEVEKALGLR